MCKIIDTKINDDTCCSLTQNQCLLDFAPPCANFLSNTKSLIPSDVSSIVYSCMEDKQCFFNSTQTRKSSIARIGNSIQQINCKKCWNITFVLVPIENAGLSALKTIFTQTTQCNEELIEACLENITKTYPNKTISCPKLNHTSILAHNYDIDHDTVGFILVFFIILAFVSIFALLISFCAFLNTCIISSPRVLDLEAPANYQTFTH